jgi:hypothetical protein
MLQLENNNILKKLMEKYYLNLGKIMRGVEEFLVELKVEVMPELAVEVGEEEVFEVVLLWNLAAKFHSFEFFLQQLLKFLGQKKMLKVVKNDEVVLPLFHIQDKGNHMSLPVNKGMLTLDDKVAAL